MRLTFISPADLTPEQRPLYEDMKAGISAKYTTFTTMSDDGTILGPWSAWLHEPEGHCNLGRHESDDTVQTFARRLEADRDPRRWCSL